MVLPLSLPLTALLFSQLFACIAEKCLLGEVIIAFLNDFMLRHTATLNHSLLIPSKFVLWEEMRQKQCDQLHSAPIFWRRCALPHSPCLFPPMLVFDPQTKCGWVELVPERTNPLLFSGCKGIVVADTEPAAFPANHIRGAGPEHQWASTSFRINPQEREGWEG